jgi:hypothetical protein
VRRPPGFDLAEAWQRVVAKMDERRGAQRVRALADPAIIPWLRGHFGGRLVAGEPTADGRVAVELGFGETHDPATDLVAYGPRLEVLDPPEVRARLAAIGAGLVQRYGAVS